MSDYLDEHSALVRQAAERIRPHVRRTPCLTAGLDPELRLKPECFQVSGSFKVRGAVVVLDHVEAEVDPCGGPGRGQHVAQVLVLGSHAPGKIVLLP